MSKRPVFQSAVQRFLTKFSPTTIRGRLLVALVMMVVLPAVAYSIVAILVILPGGRQQVINQLESVATLKKAELETWVENLRADVAAAMVGNDTSNALCQILTFPQNTDEPDKAYQILYAYFTEIVEKSPNLDQLFLMDINGRIVLSTEPSHEDRVVGPGSQVYWKQGLKGRLLLSP
ncbi:MAG: cache domain-containing protein [Anaerolineales bacterium]|nr:cache domain-containing protein [Anaerolineales bacterium]